MLPIDDKVSPQVAHDPGNFPVFIIKVEHSSREEMDEFIPMGHSTWDGWLMFAREEEVPQGSVSIVLKRVEVVLSSSKLMKLHELISRSFDEECPHKLNRYSKELHWMA